MPPSMAAYGPANPPVPTLRQWAGAQWNSSTAAAAFDLPGFDLRGFHLLSVDPPSLMGSALLCSASQTPLHLLGYALSWLRSILAALCLGCAMSSLRFDGRRFHQINTLGATAMAPKYRAACRFDFGHQPTVGGGVWVGARDHMPPWMAAYEPPWMGSRRVPRTHPHPAWPSSPANQGSGLQAFSAFSASTHHPPATATPRRR